MKALERNCGSTCDFTMDRAQYNSSNGVVFFPYYMPYFHATYPKRYSEDQVFVMCEREPPTKDLRMELPNDYFNATSTFLAHSDIPFPYGHYEKKGDTGTRIAFYRNLMAEIKTKTKGVFKVFSHCYTPSRRENIITELQNHMEIDLFGRCSNRTCDKACFAENTKKYRFYLAFENSNCVDYITEKFFQFDNLVPVVLKKEYYQQFPAKSYIAVDDFINLKSLATYLTYLMENDDAYAQHLMWKYEYRRKMVDPSERICAICDYIAQNRVKKSYKNMKEYWNHATTCDIFFTENVLKRNEALT
ncbi:unnamed protein product [Bursaphelenchus xylophilus]|uniref:Fucosyltransferase n=1 Tax=Bursaphelenchus xylophilus TaxID=6326 RepID=A0A1I7RQC3_BURXY|nr:unnamed protein product [Bursaphelenchus xylophilus]CAG9104344.1 unnamed protein product [Bursaphelenchus xylophilus]